MNSVSLRSLDFIRFALLKLIARAQAVILAGVCMLFLAGHLSVFAQSPLVDNDVQLRGSPAQHTLPIHVRGSSPQAVELQLHWAVSPLADSHRSFVHLVVDGQIRSTRRIADLAQSGWRVQLRPLTPGKHELSIQSHLRGKNDDCLPLTESLWLTLLGSSSMVGASRSQSTDSAIPLAVRDIMTHWASPSSPLAVGSATGHQTVLLTHDLTWNSAAASSWLQAQFFLMSRGLSAQLDKHDILRKDSSPNATATLALRSWERLAPDHPARQRWKEVQDTLYVLYMPATGKLEIITRSPEHVQLALDLLADDSKRQICHQSLCSVSASGSPTTASALSPQASAGPQLWRMAVGDQPRGWTARGVGTHRLRQVWVRPVTMEMQSEVRMHLAARVSQAEQIDSEQSSITLRINDQPVATYSLNHWKSSHAKVRIPPSLWHANAWVMDFEVRLVARNVKRCSHFVQDDFWVVIDSETQIEAQYKLAEAAAIAGFWQRASQRSVISLNWPPSAVGLPSDNELAPFAPLLQTYYLSSPASNWGRFEFVSSSACAKAACIFLHTSADSGTSDSRVFTWKNALASQLKSAQNLPDLSHQNSAVMVWLAGEGGIPEQLHLGLGAAQIRPLPAPPWVSFNGNIAILTDRWQVFADEASYKSSLHAPPPLSTGNVSNQQGRLRWINLVWALASLLIISGLALMYWRKQRKPDPKTWEVQ